MNLIIFKLIPNSNFKISSDGHQESWPSRRILPSTGTVMWVLCYVKVTFCLLGHWKLSCLLWEGFQFFEPLKFSSQWFPRIPGHPGGFSHPQGLSCGYFCILFAWSSLWEWSGKEIMASPERCREAITTDGGGRCERAHSVDGTMRLRLNTGSMAMICSGAQRA